MIKSFDDKVTAAVFQGKRPRQLPPGILKRAREKLDMVDAAEALDDLRVPPANQLEKLSGDRAGQWSIRINQQWRVCFVWDDGHAHNVEIVDYH
ncbi:type II toxin-antitoxin system RelE/ParE family toxin [Sedimenticola hydrogenitrophicus]|uniref:type II toxin-antitoxin system RelE/ParE family toxin n=1 Tax=Sedimenticola hydrogenitrophicus TaxID=2967975 RepID=UPI0023AFA991|nr:type II toxin-antitoxin system RelE/ParE family toxin [Sedimenticola hydrogenitrophicus]